MKNSLHLISIVALISAAAPATSLLASPDTPAYAVRPDCKSGNACVIRPGTYGYNDTTWRVWPTQYRPEASDPRAVGARHIPTPPGVPEVKLSPGGGVPAKPPVSGEILPGTIGPSTSGAKTAPALPGLPAPGEKSPDAPGPDGTLILPPGDLGTPKKLQDFSPRGEGGGPVQPSGKTPASPNAAKPDTGTQTPPAKEPAKIPSRDKPDSGMPSFAPPPTDMPTAPGEITPSKPAPHGAALPRQHSPVAGDWNNEESQASRDSRQALRPASFQERPAERIATLRSPLENFCPVELRDKEKWIAGRADFQATYDGQVYHFSSAAARQRFAAAPEKYAPVQRGNDVVLAMEENRSVAGSIRHSAVWQGRVYLFASSASLAAFRQDPARYIDRPPAAASAERPQPIPQQALQLPADSI
jgi:YHS domain-containing protein